MRVRIDIEVTPDRLVVTTADRQVKMDEPNIVSLERSRNGTSLIAAIGRSAQSDGQKAGTVPGVSVDQFDPVIAAGVVGWAAKRAWALRRPGLFGLIGVVDRVEVHVSIDRYLEIPLDARRRFETYLPYYPQLHWWVEGKKVAD